MHLALASGVRTRTFAALSFRFAIRSDDPGLNEHLEGMLTGLRDAPDDGASMHWYTLTTTPDGIDISCDDELVALGLDRGAVPGWLLWDLNRAAAQTSVQHLLFHAAALESRWGGILFPGASGSGKSTLSAALAATEMGYLSDELVALDLDSGHLLPYAKPISIKSGSFELLSHLRPARRKSAGGQAIQMSRDEWQVAVGGETGLPVGTRCLPRLVIAPRFTKGAESAVEPMTETEAFLSLAANALNPREHGWRGTEALAAIAAQCSCFELVFSDLRDACQLILELVRGCAS